MNRLELTTGQSQSEIPLSPSVQILPQKVRSSLLSSAREGVVLKTKQSFKRNLKTFLFTED